MGLRSIQRNWRHLKKNNTSIFRLASKHHPSLKHYWKSENSLRSFTMIFKNILVCLTKEVLKLMHTVANPNICTSHKIDLPNKGNNGHGKIGRAFDWPLNLKLIIREKQFKLIWRMSIMLPVRLFAVMFRRQLNIAFLNIAQGRKTHCNHFILFWTSMAMLYVILGTTLRWIVGMSSFQGTHF